MEMERNRLRMARVSFLTFGYVLMWRNSERTKTLGEDKKWALKLEVAGPFP